MKNLQLTETANKLYNSIKEKGSMWELNTIESIYPKPIYSKETAADFWQWEANAYGYKINRPVNGENIWFEINVEVSYMDIVYNAAKELKSHNLISSRNNGYNEYSYHIIN
jgi:hypothetical protein